MKIRSKNSCAFQRGQGVTATACRGTRIAPLADRGVAASSPLLVGGDVMTQAALLLAVHDVILWAVRAQVQQPSLAPISLAFHQFFSSPARVCTWKPLRSIPVPKAPRRSPRRPFSRLATRSRHHYRSGSEIFPGSGAFLVEFRHLLPSSDRFSVARTRADGGAIDIARVT